MPRVRTFLRWLPSLAWMVVIFYASSLPGSDVPGDYSVYAHFIEYAILAALLFVALRHGRSPRQAAVLAVVIASLYGASDEIHQLFTPGRVSDPLDWLTDTAGAAFAGVVAALISRRGSSTRPDGSASD